MSRCLCVNMDKEEFLEFGDLPENSYRDAAACSTVQYYLATDWAGDSIVFAFEKMEAGGICPEDDQTLFEYALLNFDERCVLNSVPAFRFLVNLDKNIYYDKNDIPQGTDGLYLDPVSLLLAASKDVEELGINLTDAEKSELGTWKGDKLMAVNNISRLSGMSCVTPSFKFDVSGFSGKLKGLNIVVTGTFPTLDRMEVEELIREEGGTPQKSVTRKTNYLVVGNKPGTTKIAKARNYGICELSVKEFMDMLK